MHQAFLRQFQLRNIAPRHLGPALTSDTSRTTLLVYRGMATAKSDGSSGIPHEVRTATEPRQRRLYPVRLSHISQVNPTIRLLRLDVSPSLTSQRSDEGRSPPPLQFLPGQWLDVHIPSIPQAGGFTITSTPAQATSSDYTIQKEQIHHVDSKIERAQQGPYIELAVQHSPSNPPAAWLWRPESQILGTELNVRVGGGFVWPPPGQRSVESIRKVVFVAGGVGINPLISMLSHIYQSPTVLPASTPIHLIYSTRMPACSADDEDTTSNSDLNRQLDQILFLPRIRKIMQSQKEEQEQQQQNPRSQSQRQDPRAQGRPLLRLRLHLTNLDSSLEKGQSNDSAGQVDIAGLSDQNTRDVAVYQRRITLDDLREVIDDADVDVRAGTVCYVCGPPRMTDDFVGALENMVDGKEDSEKRVFCEKWW